MNKDDPFAVTDSDKTILMPTPGGRLPPRVNPTSQSSYESANTGIDTETSAITTGLNPLIAAANPLLNTVSQLRATLQHNDPVGLRDNIIQNIKLFENRAKAAGIPSEKVVATRYLLCTLLDETIASTPWGSGQWGGKSLLVLFHNEASGGEKFFKLLTKLIENPKANRDILEFMHICLALGFEGRYRILENGKSHLETLREKLTQTLNKEHGDYESDLSPHWQGTSTQRTKILTLLPLWVLSALCGIVLLSTYISFNYLLNDVSDPVFRDIQSIKVKAPAPKLAKLPPPPITPLITEFLHTEIQQGLVSVHNDHHSGVIITLLGDGIFASGSTEISGQFVTVLERIADQLNTVPGQILVKGHTDNVPMKSVRFPSNWHLSMERARSVMQLLIKMGAPENRISAEGYADAEPVTSNSTAQGRARNRRVEIVLYISQSNL